MNVAVRLGLIHGVLRKRKCQQIRAHKRKRSAARSDAEVTWLALSFIRTVTVGPGISPDLLTPCSGQAAAWALAALVRSCRHAAITAGGEFHPALRTLVSGTGPNGVDCRHAACMQAVTLAMACS